MSPWLGLWFPDIWSNITQDVSVKVFYLFIYLFVTFK